MEKLFRLPALLGLQRESYQHLLDFRIMVVNLFHEGT